MEKPIFSQEEMEIMAEEEYQRKITEESCRQMYAEIRVRKNHAK